MIVQTSSLATERFPRLSCAIERHPMIDELILGLLVAMFGSFGAVAWSLRGRIEKLPQETAERTTAPLVKAIDENSAEIAKNRDRIDEVRKDLSGQIGYTNRRIDSIYHLLVGGKGEFGAEADPASGEAVGASS